MSAQTAKKPAETLDLPRAQKVTALLLAMGKASADRVLSLLSNAEIHKVAVSAASLPPITSDKLEKIYTELEEAISSAAQIVGSTDEAANLISGVVSEDTANLIMTDLTGDVRRVDWQALDQFDTERLTAFIASEPPQAAAYIVSRLTYATAAQVLTHVDDRLRADIGKAMLEMAEPPERAVAMVEKRVMEGLLDVQDDSSGRKRLGSLLNHLEREHADQVLDSLSVSNPDDAAEIRNMVFRFEDVVRLEEADRSKLFDSVQAEALIVALQGAAEELVSSVLDVVSARSRRMIEQELAGGAPARPAEIKKARMEIAELARDMGERELIKLVTAAGAKL